MTKRFNFRPVPVDFGDRFPDGVYAVGRGADPRLPAPAAKPHEDTQSGQLPRPRNARRRQTDPAAR